MLSHCSRSPGLPAVCTTSTPSSRATASRRGRSQPILCHDWKCGLGRPLKSYVPKLAETRELAAAKTQFAMCVRNNAKDGDWVGYFDSKGLEAFKGGNIKGATVSDGTTGGALGTKVARNGTIVVLAAKSSALATVLTESMHPVQVALMDTTGTAHPVKIAVTVMHPGQSS